MYTFTVNNKRFQYSARIQLANTRIEVPRQRSQHSYTKSKIHKTHQGDRSKKNNKIFRVHVHESVQHNSELPKIRERNTYLINAVDRELECKSATEIHLAKNTAAKRKETKLMCINVTSPFGPQFRVLGRRNPR